MSSRVPPHSEDSEATVLGAMLMHSKAIPGVAAIVRPSDFYHTARAAICEAIFALDAASTPVDVVTVRDQLRHAGILDRLNTLGGPAYLTELLGAVVTVENVEHHAEIVARKAARRERIKLAELTAAAGYGEASDNEFDATADELSAKASAYHRNGGPAPVASVMRLVDREMDRQMERNKAGAETTGIPSGLVVLDGITGGFHTRELSIVAARPSMGKTQFALNVVEHAAANKKIPSLFFSVEMNNLSLGQRMVSTHARLNSYQIRNAYLKQEGILAAHRSMATLGDRRNPLWFDDQSSKFHEIAATARSWRARECPNAEQALIVVDYLQLVSYRVEGRDNGNREREVAMISNGLKSLAKQLNVAVVALCQLNRRLEERDDKRPMLSDLRESGAIEQDGDLITFLYRDEVYKPDSSWKDTAEIIIAKQRNGAIGNVRVACDMGTGRFSNLKGVAA